MEAVQAVAVKGYDILIDDVNRMINNDRVMVAAVNTVLSAQKKRIFQDGKTADEAQIGTYSTNPISISKKNQAKNTGKTYFKGGYREYKSLTGKNASYVTLWNTGQMMQDLSTQIVGPKEYGIGFTNEFNADKAEWNEGKYKKDIFSTTEKEDELFLQVVDFELNRS